MYSTLYSTVNCCPIAALRVSLPSSSYLGVLVLACVLPCAKNQLSLSCLYCVYCTLYILFTTTTSDYSMYPSLVPFPARSLLPSLLLPSSLPHLTPPPSTQIHSIHIRLPTTLLYSYSPTYFLCTLLPCTHRTHTNPPPYISVETHLSTRAVRCYGTSKVLYFQYKPQSPLRLVLAPSPSTTLLIDTDANVPCQSFPSTLPLPLPLLLLLLLFPLHDFTPHRRPHALSLSPITSRIDEFHLGRPSTSPIRGLRGSGG